MFFTKIHLKGRNHLYVAGYHCPVIYPQVKRKTSTALVDAYKLHTHNWKLQVLQLTDLTSLAELRNSPLPPTPDTVSSLFCKCLLLLHIYSNCRHFFFFKASRNFSVALKLLVLRHNRKWSWETDAEAGLSWCNNERSTETRPFQTENLSSELILGNKKLKWMALACDRKNLLREEGMTHELWHCRLFCWESKLRVPFSPTLQTLHMFYTQNILPPTLNTLILFSYLPPHLFCKTKYEQQLNDKTSNSLGLIWHGGMIFVAMQTCNLYESKSWSFSECTGCPIVFHALLIWVQMTSRDLHTFQHELGHLAEENTSIHKSGQATVVTCTAKILDRQHWEQKEG